MKRLIIGISAEGSVVLLEGQAKYFVENGYQTFLLSPYSERVKEFCERECCTHLRINIKREISLISDIVVLLRIVYLFLKIKPDIINLGTPKVSLLGMIAGRLVGVKRRIYTCRGFRFEHETGLKRLILIAMERITARNANKIVCISPSLKKFGIENRLFNEEKAIVINAGSSNGFDLSRFSPLSVSKNSVDQLKIQLGIQDKFVFGFVGRIVDRKGINELYEAFDAICNTLPDIKLLIVGSFEEKQISNKAIIQSIKSHENILHVGSQKDVPLYITLMNILILPAWWEGFGNVLVQAAALGVPVIGTETTGVKDAVSNNYNGLLIEPRNTDQLVKAMRTLYDDKRLRDKFGSNGIEWAKNFDNKTIWKGLEEVYNTSK